MKKITDAMIVSCLWFIKEQGGAISRYSFDRFVTKKIRINESFNLVPKELLKEELISFSREGKETRVMLTSAGIDKLSSELKKGKI
jgi:hypothetical protein